MEITDAEFFFKNYVGYHPEEEWMYESTKGMIEHYVESGLKDRLLDIYEACAEDGVLTADNIPHHLWQDGNILIPGQFYLHPELTLMQRAPEINIFTGEAVVKEHYREIKELYTLNDVLIYASKLLRRDTLLKDENQDIGAVKHLLKRYARQEAELGIMALDMVMFLIRHHKGERIELINISQGEDEVALQVRAYAEKLKSMNRHRIIWRGNIKCCQKDTSK
jgi:hypothetical protein